MPQEKLPPNAINPRAFGITANDCYIHTSLLSMNETGKLVVMPWPKEPETD